MDRWAQQNKNWAPWSQNKTDSATGNSSCRTKTHFLESKAGKPIVICAVRKTIRYRDDDRAGDLTWHSIRQSSGVFRGILYLDSCDGLTSRQW